MLYGAAVANDSSPLPTTGDPASPINAPHLQQRWGLGDVTLGFVVGQAGGLVLMTLILAVTGRTLDEIDDLPLALVALAQVGLWLGLLGVPLLATRRKGHGGIADLGLRGRLEDAWKSPSTRGSAHPAWRLVIVGLVAWRCCDYRSTLGRP